MRGTVAAAEFREAGSAPRRAVDIPRPGVGLEVALLIACTLVALAIRLYHLGSQILGGDELHVLRVLGSTPLSAIPGTVGDYDYSIPLALLYGTIARFTALDESILRAPMVLFGALTPVAAWYAFRPLVTRTLALALAFVVAIHPFCVFYGRFVRPYGIVLVLLLVTLGLLVRAFDGAGTARGAWRRVVLAALASSLAGWLSVPALLGCAGIGSAALTVAALERSERRASLWRLALAYGVATLLFTALLYLPALTGLHQRVLGKGGQGLVQTEMLLRTGRVLAGSVHGLVLAAASGLALLGVIATARRRRTAEAWMFVPIVVVFAEILVSKPQLVEYDLVMARYAFPALPFLVVAALLGVEALGARFSRGSGSRAAAPAIVVSVVIWSGFAASSLRSIYGAERAYAHHGRYQTYEHLRAPERDARALAHPVYARLGDAPLVLEWPPPGGFKKNLLHLGQEVHRRPLRLLIQDEQPFSLPFVALDNVLVVGSLDADPPPPGTAILIHKSPLAEGASLLAQRATRRVPVRNPDGVQRLVALLTARFGTPAFEDAYVVLFRVPWPAR